MSERSRLCGDMRAALPGLYKAVLSQPADKNAASKVTVRPLRVKSGVCYQIESFRDNKAFHKNVPEAELMDIFASELDGKYRQALILGEDGAYQYSLRRDGSYKRSAAPSVARPEGVGGHNREKGYILREGERIPALVELGVFTEDYRIVRAKYDKYKQINRFIELIDQQLADTDKKGLTILDFGCGKSYLTFIMYYYLTVIRGVYARIIGYDLKADVIEACSALAEKYGYSGMSFVRADVTRDALYNEHIDMIVTLHACDTATDYALDYAIRRGVEHIFSVPCCQHEVNLTIKKGGELDIFMEHGIIKERMSALLTDAIRAQVLEAAGYRVDLIEFIDFEHSPKNIMIRARRGGKRDAAKADGARALAGRYGFSQSLLRLTEGGEEK